MTTNTAVSDAPSIDVRGAAVVAVGTQDQLVHTTQASSQRVPSVTGLDGGGWVVTWQDNRNGGYYDIYQRAYDAQGEPETTEDQLVHTDSFYELFTDQKFSSVTGLAGGGWVVTWEDRRNGNWDIYQRAYDAQGEAIGIEVQLDHMSQSSRQWCPSTTTRPGGGCGVYWVVIFRGLYVHR